MKQRFVTIVTVCVSMVFSLCPPAIAGNAAVEEALRRHSEHSSFYKALQETGILAELQEGASYTVLAPTNSAFAAAQRKTYPCFSTMFCREEMVGILRSHIVPGTQYIGSLGAGKNALFSINQRLIPVGQPTRNVYAVDGQRIMNSAKFNGGMLYTIDGVILPRLAKPTFEQAEERVTTVTKKTIPNPDCGPGGCPDAYSETTVITRRVPDMSPAAR